ncbi:hypothetical protein PBI_KRATIO_66 [Mycobacterium phage Kratio]|uniref:Uncharacterized protein n=1 Tax=Mycobacterium phage Kratio TaxID=1606763 RepID=A0A0C5AMT8_9CAUD|nr:hypothetical protein PBI_KRATIO_66 [Mycobacterium phage Kratio]AJK27395.1 hypothetical protein PBI_KRATIO_66 [Mycobacterium phage Kratio]
MTKTEAAEIVANEVLVWARSNGATPTKSLVEARISELRVTATPGTYLHTASLTANWRTTLAVAKRWF